MGLQGVLPKSKDRVFCCLTFGIICALTLVCIAEAFKNNIFRNGYVSLNALINFAGQIFIIGFLGYLFSKTEVITKPMRMFTLFLLNVHVSIFFSNLAFSNYGIASRVMKITVIGTLNYFFIMAVYMTLWLYQKQFLEESAVTRAVTILMAIVLMAYTGALVINLFRPILFQITPDGVLSDSVKDYISITTGFLCLVLLGIAAFFSKMSRSRKFSFLCCIFVPILFAMLSVNEDLLKQNIYIWGVVSLTVILPICLMFFSSHDALEKEQAHLRVSTMISQMRPHFLYNSLAVIAALCEEDPKLAAKATNAFSDYLRENMDFADRDGPIPFSEELKHIKTYVWLEKLRFPDKLSVEYDVKSTDFLLPALSVQPMVENAIKHGICKAKSGGTVRISSLETDRFYVVEISDDGTGFDQKDTFAKGGRHLGIKNTKYRVKEMVGGSLDIESSPGRGTAVTIKIPK